MNIFRVVFLLNKIIYLVVSTAGPVTLVMAVFQCPGVLPNLAKIMFLSPAAANRDG
jgi:hypothetical protein